MGFITQVKSKMYDSNFLQAEKEKIKAYYEGCSVEEVV